MHLSFRVLLLVCCPWAPLAGPPFTTDDPEPVKYQHWEFYVASQNTKSADGWSGTAPHFEVNYGAVTNLQLHLIAPLAYDAPAHGTRQYGYGDTEVGAKYRFIQETDVTPQVGLFPMLEIPTGSANRGLGSGQVQAFLPVWLQKEFGSWTVYGGGGYGINPGAGHQNWGYGGLVGQFQVSKGVLLGAELYHRTATDIGTQADTAFNLGAVIDFNERHHLLFSAGRSITGPTEFQAYIAYQFTFGPGLFHSKHHARSGWGSEGG
jgi:hypothetical protein